MPVLSIGLALVPWGDSHLWSHHWSIQLVVVIVNLKYQSYTQATTGCMLRLERAAFGRSSICILFISSSVFFSRIPTRSFAVEVVSAVCASGTVGGDTLVVTSERRQSLFLSKYKILHTFSYGKVTKLDCLKLTVTLVFQRRNQLLRRLCKERNRATSWCKKWMGKKW